MIQFDEHIFEAGCSNHQLVTLRKNKLAGQMMLNDQSPFLW